MNKEYSLCNICDRLVTCDRAKEQNKKIYYCEDFLKTADTSKTYIHETVNNTTEKIGNNMENGLCKICENRHVCGIKIPNGGLWHCENFL